MVDTNSGGASATLSATEYREYSEVVYAREQQPTADRQAKRIALN